MPDIDPAALTRSDSFLQPLPPQNLPVKLNGNAPTVSQKASKPITSAQRIDLESLYTSLKSAIGDHWAEYKEAVSLFTLGHLSQSEFSLRTDYFLTADPSTEHFHNQLIAAIYTNVSRDPPDAGIAPWVSANDKPTILSKPVSGDAAEQRLKTEVMQIPGRERRRLKDAPNTDTSEISLNHMIENNLAKQFKVPDIMPTTAGGPHNKNWDLEIRKRYAQPLASETGEFPDAEIIHSRLVPICYEESLVNGAAPACSEFLVTATEQFIKEILSTIYSRTRSNISSSANGIMTHKYRQQVAREEEALRRGSLIRGQSNGLLPVELREAITRKPLGMSDLRLAFEVGNTGLGQMPAITQKVLGGHHETDFDDHPFEEMDIDGPERADNVRMNGNEVVTNGINGFHGDDMSIDESDWGWEGGGAIDRETLNSLLDECLAIGQ